MMQQKATIHYRDGTSEPVLITQYGLSRYAQDAARRGWPTSLDTSTPSMFGIVQLRYQAWVEVHRDQTGKWPTFDVWDATVDDIDLDDAADVDPTQPGTSGG